MVENDVVGPSEPNIGSRFQCSQCESSFARKEHLTRHVKTHDSELSHMCSVCGKQFNRSDSLLRHLNKHGGGFKTASRSKRACLACHTSKVKCDGENQCHACVKKGIECRYRLPNEPHLLEETIERRAVQDHQNNPIQEPLLHADASQDGSNHSSYNELRRGVFPPLGSQACIYWSRMRVEPDPVQQPDFTYNEKYLESYFNHFHHRLTIIHRPSYNIQNSGLVLQLLLFSMGMIGAWLEGSPSAREYALANHKTLVSQCLKEICKISSMDKFQQSLPASLCHAILMNVVFALYCGQEKAVSGGIILFNLLVAALREVGFFDPNHIWADQMPDYFLPMKLVKMGERQRLLQHLFRIDTYLSIIRGNARSLAAEELVFEVPVSFSLYNADGLDIFEQRVGDKSPFRSQKTQYEMTKHVACALTFPKDGVLIEDIQLSLCTVHLKLWHFNTQLRNQSYQIGNLESERGAIKAHLDCLKLQLDQIRLLPISAELLSHYYGYEDHTQPGWEPIVETRVHTLHFDTLMLYHLLSLHLYIDPARLVLVANEFALDLTTFTLDQQQVIGKRRCNTASWVSEPTARRSICNAVNILAEMQALDTKPDIDRHRLDPISYIAISTAALVVWIHLHFGVYACRTCGPGLGFDLCENNEVNLGPGDDTKVPKEVWIENSFMSRVKIDGVEICACNLVKIIEKFKAFIPEGWELTKSIAPGVFQGVYLANLARVAEEGGSDRHH